MSSNTELNILVKFKDLISKPMGAVQNQLRQFSANFKQNWIGITAAITGAVIALRKAWDLADMGAQAQQIEQSFARMASAMGINNEAIQKSMNAAAASTVNFSNVAAKASALMAQGLNMDQITALMQQARAEAQIFGTTTEEAFNTISGAVTGGLVVSLKRSYGMQVSLAQATKDYAIATGLSTEEVEKNYQAQAIANHIIDKGRSHLEAVNLEMLTQYERLQVLKSNWNTFLEQTGILLIKFTTLAISGWQRILQVFFVMMEKVTALFQKIPMLSNNLRSELMVLREQAKLTAAEFGAKAAQNYTLVFSKISEGSEEAARIYAEAMKKSRDETASTADSFAAIRDKIREGAQEARSEYQSLAHSIQSMTKRIVADAETSFGNFFYNTLKGQVTSAKDLFRSFGDYVLQMLSQVMAKLALFGMDGKGGLMGLMSNKYTAGGFLGGLGSLFGGANIKGYATGTDYVPRTGIYKLHQGEKVVPAHEVKEESKQGSQPIIVSFNLMSAADVHRHRKTIEDIVSSAVSRNASLRGSINKYA